MTQYILINRIKVQNANAVAGFTWGFPAITHFMGFVHSLSRQLQTSGFEYISLNNCGVIAHEQHVHTYGEYNDNFTQSKNPPYMKGSTTKDKPPSVIEEGKMNMTVSLLVGYSGRLAGNSTDEFLAWLKKQCLLQRLAGGTILSIEGLQKFDITDLNKRLLLKRKLLPGFALIDKSEELEKHYENNLEINEDSELMDSWLDFSLLKRKARPKSDLITKHLKKYDKNNDSSFAEDWSQHIASGSYTCDVPPLIQAHFEQLKSNKSNKAVLAQWKSYLEPDNKTPADWERLPKPTVGYLVPIMTGYKAVSPLYKNSEIENTRDYETDVRFVESVHSVGEWRGVNRLREVEDFERCLWEYTHEDEWYLCRQAKANPTTSSKTKTTKNRAEF